MDLRQNLTGGGKENITSNFQMREYISEEGNLCLQVYFSSESSPQQDKQPDAALHCCLSHAQ